jgi:putative ABC transport system ATP-binding protein
VHALDGVDVSIAPGEFVSLTGASGSGKSTLMHLMGCLDRPTSGILRFDGEMISRLGDKELANIRNRRIGFVFQTFNLITRTSAMENVLVPLVYTRKPFSRKIARDALERVGLGNRGSHRPSEMSGGECQRVAIARAIVNKPKLLLADEPTGNLDTRTGEQIMAIFHELHASGMTIILVTHEMDVAAQAERMIQMRDGKIVEDVAIDASRRDEMLSTAHRSQERASREKTASKPTPRPGSLTPGRERQT